MNIRSSLRQKSILALAIYLVFFIATIGTIMYFVIEPPVRSKIEQNLDLRTQLLASQIEGSLNQSIGLVQGLVSLGESPSGELDLTTAITQLLLNSNDIVVGGGLWPKPYYKNKEWHYKSIFFNKNTSQSLDKIHSYNNPEAGGYNHEDWYKSVENKPEGTRRWSGVYIDTFTQVQMITISEPYYKNKKFAGVVTVDLSLKALFNFIQNHTDKYKLGVLIRDAEHQVITDHNFNVSKNIYISQFKFGDFNWTMKVVNSDKLVADEVFDQIVSTETRILPFLLLCVLVGYYWLNAYVITPIINIAKQVYNSKAGEIIDIHDSSDDEITHLVEAFNKKTIYLEEEKIKAQASTNAKTVFLATLSHEIRTPMNGVLGSAQILLKTKLDPEQREYLKTLYDSGDHMMTLLNEILDYSKIEQGHIELSKTKFPIERLLGSIGSVYHSLCEEKDLTFKIMSHIDKDRWYFTDKARVRQILFNLLSNAVKFTVVGGIEIHFREKTTDQQTRLYIEVKDTGIGISPESQARIFRPFEQAESSTTRRYGGTGLGLAIVKQITEHMGGSVAVESQLGLGSTFYVELNLDISEPDALDLKPHGMLNCQDLRALIVEDNRTNALIMNSFLKEKGFTCTHVENGQLAVDITKNQQFDIILMDNHMPVLDGIDAIKLIRKEYSPCQNILILGCTADVFEETRDKLMNAGAQQIIPKPIVESQLDDALHHFSDLLYQYQPRLKSRT